MRFLLVLCVCFMSFAANAQPVGPCGPRGGILSILSERYGEARQSMGMDSKGAIVEIYTSPAGSFTILMTTPDGRSCLISGGEFWETATDVQGTAL